VDLAAMLGTSVAVAVPASAAVDQFIKLDDLKGESLDEKHRGEVDVLAWSWGLSNSLKAVTAGAGTGKVALQALSFTKYVDKSSAGLISALVTGRHLKTATLTLRKAGGKAPLEYLRITLEDVIVSSVSVAGSSGEERLTENVSLTFARFRYEYVPQKADGSGEASVKAGYDAVKNEEVK
jgi:type VI secretion system secreted protein Hcp